MEEDSVQDCNQPSQIGQVLPQGNVVEINEACVPSISIDVEAKEVSGRSRVRALEFVIERVLECIES